MVAMPFANINLVISKIIDDRDLKVILDKNSTAQLCYLTRVKVFATNDITHFIKKISKPWVCLSKFFSNGRGQLLQRNQTKIRTVLMIWA